MPKSPPTGPTLADSTVHLAWAARLTPSPPPPGEGAPHDAEAAPKMLRPQLRPLPQLPAADRSALHAEPRMRVAVALDVICSATRKIAPGPTVLVQATRAWLSLRGRHQSADLLDNLIAQAHGPQAVARARISRALTRLASGVSRPEASGSASEPTGTAASTPQSVALANRHVEAAGEAIVAEMVLWLASRERVEYRRG